MLASLHHQLLHQGPEQVLIPSQALLQGILKGLPTSWGCLQLMISGINGVLESFVRPSAIAPVVAKG